MKNILYAAVVLGAMFISSCEPNADIYEKLDATNDANPFHKTITYTLTSADYAKNVTGNATVEKYKAFNDTLPAASFIPKVLANFAALKLNSSASVTYNYMPLHPSYMDAKFGYELTTADYNSFGDATITANQSFNSAKKSTAFIPGFLLTKYPAAVLSDTVNILLRYDFRDNLERYRFDGALWARVTTITKDTEFGVTLVDGDYLLMGGDVAKYKNFSATVLSENYIPSLLKVKYPFALAGAVRIVKFKYYAGSASDKIEQYNFNGSVWTKTPSVITQTDPYIYGPLGWAFDPTVYLTMAPADYQLIVSKDPIPDPVFTDFAYYYGASGKYGNFDNRVSKRKALNPEMEGKSDAECITIMMDRLPAAIVIMLQEKYKSAVPVLGGLEVHYIIIYKTYNNDLSYTTYKVDYKCTASGTPATFELVSGPTAQ